MKLTPENRQEIALKFKLIKSIDELAKLLQWIYELKYPKRNKKTPVTIDPNHLTYYAFVAKNQYYHFEIPKKKRGETRPISSPTYKLKTIQKCINEILNSVFVSHPNSFGFIPNKSIVDNAKLHIGKNFVYNIDLDSFFPSTEFRRIKSVLELKPFYLTADKEPLAFLIANICCYNGFLPQGAPTSPTLTNIVCQRLDRKLTKLAGRYNATYSRYADDITFSAKLNIFDKWFKARLKIIIERQENFKIKLEKERLQNWNTRQEVTGIIVNNKSNVNRDYIKDVRYWLRTWNKFGTSATQANFVLKFPEKKGYKRYNGEYIVFQNYLAGKILYLGMVRGKEDKLYQSFRHSLKELTTANFSTKQKSSSISQGLLEIVTALEQNDILKATQIFNNLSV